MYLETFEINPCELSFCTEVSMANNLKKDLNEYNTSNRRGFDVDIMAIRRKENIDKFPCRFNVFFDVNSMGEKSM